MKAKHDLVTVKADKRHGYEFWRYRGYMIAKERQTGRYYLEREYDDCYEGHEMHLFHNLEDVRSVIDQIYEMVHGSALFFQATRGVKA